MKRLDKNNVQDILALTPLQEGMLVQYLKNPGSDYYFEQLSLEISGEIDKHIFENAWNCVIETNEMLRVVFRWEELEKPSQIILKEHKGKVIFYDLSDKNSSQKKTALEEIKDKDRRETFDLHRVPFRVILCKLEEKKYELIISNHHILYDGWSNGIILKEFFMAYHELRHGGRSLKLPVKPPFKEFIKGVQSQDRNKQEQFWREYLAGVETPTELPIKKQGEETPGTKDYSIILAEGLRGQLDLFVKNHHVTLAAVFYTAWGILLQKYCNSQDVIFGTTVSGRSAGIKGIETMVGLFINTLPLRVQSAPGLKLIDILSGVENLLPVREEFEQTPLVDIGSYSPVGAGASLFDTIVVIENYPLDSRLLPEDSLLSVNSYSTAETPHYDLTVGILALDNIKVNFIYNPELFVKEVIEKLARHFKGIVQNVVENPETGVYCLEIISSEEKNRILYEFNNTAAEYPANETIHQLFVEQVLRTPDRIAVIGSTVETPRATSLQITYRELHKQTDGLARVLIEKGVLADTIVGIMLERSVEMIVGILAILKSGGAYLPIDPEYPLERIDYMLKDSGTKILIIKSEIRNSKLESPPARGRGYPVKNINDQIINAQNRNFKDLMVLDFEHLNFEFVSNFDILASNLLSSTLTYLIYTSGSTGRPKGVLVEHRSVVNLICNQDKYFNINHSDRILQFSSICFDASVEQIFIAFSSGAILVLIDKNTLLDVDQFEKFVFRHQISHIHAVPSFLNNIHLRNAPQLKRVIAGGDVCPVSLAKKWSTSFDFYNEYGPTETTVTSMEILIKAANAFLFRLPVGKPISNTIVYLLDQWMKPVPLGVIGELYIGGVGVARGYLNRPELTAERFKRAVISHSSLVIGDPNDQCPMTNDRSYKLYKTGDLARWLPDGNIEFLGRIDRQVKINGFRIELEEIEKQLINFTYNYNAGSERNTWNTGDTREVTYCSRCVLPSTYPGIHFDREGVCNICREYETLESRIWGYFKTTHDFHQLVEIARASNKGQYDCMLLFSGGKDSSYVLYRLVEMGLKVLAFTFDNGYISNTALENIKRITTRLGVDSIVCTTPKMKGIFVQSLSHEHTVCTGCFKALTTISTQVAVEKNINMVITGLSRGQIFDTKLHELYSQGIFDVKEVEEKLLIFRKMYHSGGDKISQLLKVYNYRTTADSLEEHRGNPIGIFTDEVFQNIHFVDFFRYDNASIMEIKSYLNNKDSYWQKPGDTGFCSTNCIINDVGIYVYTHEKGYHNYAAPLSWDCRLGKGTREEAFSEIEFEPDREKVNKILAEIGYFDRPIRDACVVDAEDKNGNKYLCAYIVPVNACAIENMPNTRELRAYLSQVLPGYMVPSFFVPLAKLPFTPTGKVDRKTLPTLVFKSANEYVAPANAREEKMVKIWSEVLGETTGNTAIGINDNFFELGGQSLKTTILAARIHKEFNVKIPLGEIFKKPTIKELTRYIDASAPESYERIYPSEEKDYYLQSSSQKRLYFLQQMDNEGISYNIPSVWILFGSLHKDRFEQAFRHLIERHESLRTSFELIDEEPVQRIHEQVEFEIDKSFAELFQKRLPEGPPKAPPGGGTLEEIIRPFDLSKAPLLRVGLIKIEEGKHLLMVDMHHIITDETSMNVMVKDFLALYQGEDLSELRVQYKDFSVWRNNKKQREFIKRQEDYWLKEFAGEIPVLELPADYSRPSLQSFEGSRIPFELTRETTGVLKTLALETGSTIYIVLLAIYTVLLSKLTCQEDIVVGSPIAGRRHADLEKIIGMFVNTLPLRNYPSGAKTFTGFLHEVKENTLSAFENQDYQFEDLVERVAANRDTSRNPVFDAMLVLQDMERPAIEIPGLVLKPYDYENKTSKFDLNLLAMEKDGKLTFDLEYSTKLFKEETARGFSRYFKNLVNAAIENPGAGLSTMEIMSKAEKERILEISNGAAEPVDPGETIHGLFEKTAMGNKDKTALVFRDGRLTYGELNRSANRLAQRLRDKGVGRDGLVGLMVERSFRLVIGMVGIMKAGSAYLPIDPKLPGQRKSIIIEDSHMAALLINIEIESETASIPGNIEIIDIGKENIYGGKEHLAGITNINKGSDLAYVIFTSGSTGRPKGVMLKHTNIVNLIRFHHKYTGIDCSKVLQFTTMSFDVSLQEIFSTLSSGGELYLIDEETRGNIVELLEFIGKNKIKTLFLPMTFLRVIFAGEYINMFPANVRHIITAGEQAVINDGLRNCLKANNIYFHNHYGPSETHVITTLTIDPREDIPEFPSIGKPIINTGIYILDKEKHLLPVGAAGELYAGGLQVGSGYLNQPGLTAERFCLRRPGGALFEKTTPPGPPRKNFLLNKVPGKESFYRTGDRARWLADGNIEFLGRIDQQVKIHGVRVEPGEIENQLEKIGIIKDAAVVVKQDTGRETYLCAYIVLRIGTDWNESGLRNTLAINLPDYMIPAYFVQMDKIPLTPGGKIDRKALPEPELKIGESHHAPRNEIEKKLAALWAEVLGKDALHASQLQTSLGIDDNFFQLGGNSLKAIILVSKIHKELKVKAALAEIFNAPSIRGLAEFIKRAEASRFLSIARVEKKEYYALASAQKRVYILQHMDKDETTYNMTSSWSLQGVLDRDKLENTFHRLIQRHESLRTSFHMINEEMAQRIHHEVKFKIEYEEVEVKVKDGDTEGTRGLAPLPLLATRNPQPATALISSFIRPFDLSHAPLLRVGLIKQSENKYLMMVDMHHIISDGISTGIFVHDFTSIYAGNQLPALNLHYKDYAQWQDREKENLLEQGKYWKNEFEGEIPVLGLPTDYARPPVQSFAGSRINFEISKDTTAALKALMLETGTTLYMILLSFYTILLSKLGNHEDIVIGTPAAGRRHPDLEKIMGMFVNTLALRNYPSGEKKITDFIGEVKEKTLKAFENQDYQYEDLVEELSITRDVSRNPLFDTMFVLQNTTPMNINIPGLHLSPYPYENNTSKFDLTLSGVEEEGKLVFTFEYCKKLFRQETIERFIANFKKIIVSVLQDPGAKISDIDIIPGAEKRRLIYEFNDTTMAYPADKAIHRLIEAQVQRTPDHIAAAGPLELKNRSYVTYMTYISYRQLNEKSHQLAGLLRERGVGPDTIVGTMIERSIEMIIGILGILKAGGAYLPIDPDYPRERIDYMLKDSGAEILLTSQEITALPSPQALYLSEGHHPIFPASLPSNLAYIIYTSGTTGRPKGALMEHRSLVNLCCWHNRYYEVTARDNAAQYAGFGFDASAWEIFPYLIRGAAIHIIGDDIKLNIQQVGRYYNTHHITIGFLPTQFGRMFIEEWKELRTLRSLLMGGDKLNSVVETNYRLYNNYGPTENTVVTTSYLIESRPGGIPLGKPIANSRVYIVSKDRLLLQPLGVPGELCIGGAGLARGYLNRPELTAEKFCLREPGGTLFEGTRGLALPHSPIYHTGDLCKWLPDGNIEFLGRIDHQVKIRGFRVELGEIENRLATHENIKEAVVIDREDNTGEKYLCAYIVFREPNVSDHTELKSYLSQTLPEYMVPLHFLEVERIPLTLNGKVDRKRLPQPGARPENKYEAPGTPSEREIAEIWKQLLGLEKISINDNFFDAGGNSLKIIKLAIELKKCLGIEIPTAKLLQYPTIASQAKYIVRANEKEKEEAGEIVEFETDKVKSRLKQKRDKSQL